MSTLLKTATMWILLAGGVAVYWMGFGCDLDGFYYQGKIIELGQTDSLAKIFWKSRKSISVSQNLFL